MAYITTTQLQARLGSGLYARLTDRANGNSANSTVAQQIVSEAEAVANSYLAKRYATPIDLTAHPELADLLVARVLDLAEFMAWRDSPFVTGLPARVNTMHESAVKWLSSIAAGTIDLPASTPPAERTARDDGPQFTDVERGLSRDELDNV